MEGQIRFLLDKKFELAVVVSPTSETNKKLVRFDVWLMAGRYICTCILETPNLTELAFPKLFIEIGIHYQYINVLTTYWEHSRLYQVKQV